MIEDRALRAEMQRSVSRLLHISSRLVFSALFIFGCLSTTWRGNLLLDVLRVRLLFRGVHYDVSVVLLLPLVVCVLWAAGVLVQRSWQPDLPGLRRRWGLVVPVFGFGILTLIRVYPIHIPLKARVAWGNILIFWFVFVYAWIAWPPKWVWTTFGILLIVQGAVAVIQFVFQRPIGLPVFHEIAPYPTEAGASVIEASGRRWLRAYGLTPHPNVLGGYLSVMLSFVTGAWIAAPQGRRWLLVSLGLGVAGVFVSFSRSAWLGLVMGIAYLFGLLLLVDPSLIRSLKGRRTWIWMGGAIVLVTVISCLVLRDLLIARLFRLGSPLESASIQERIRDAQQAWMLIVNRPFRGVGTGTYVEALWAWADATGRDFPAFQHVHNVPLLAAVELGVGGALLWLWLLIAPPVDVARRMLTRKQVDPIQIGLGAAFLVALTTSLTDYFLYLPTTLWPALYLGGLSGLSVRFARDRAEVK